MTPLFVAGLWRYPVKTLAGERLPAAILTADGVEGDRLVQVYGPEGVRTSRRHYHLLGLRGTLGPLGQPLINGLPWDSADALALVKAAAGDDAWVEAYAGPERFDVGSIDGRAAPDAQARRRVAIAGDVISRTFGFEQSGEFLDEIRIGAFN